jgi:hypothetical protein
LCNRWQVEWQRDIVAHRGLQARSLLYFSRGIMPHIRVSGYSPPSGRAPAASGFGLARLVAGVDEVIE